MAAQSAFRWPRVSLRRLEPAVPLFLGLHGLAIMLLDPGSVAITVGFVGICLLGIAGLAGWCSTRAVTLRAAACLGLALAAQIREPGLVPAMLQWYYCVAAVYSLLMTGWRAAIIGPLAGVCYFAQVLLGSVPVPLAVALLRSAVLAALGLVMYLAGRAYRQARSDAEAHRHSRRADRPAQQGQLPRRRRGRDGRRYVDVHRAGLRRRPVQERQRRARSCDR